MNEIAISLLKVADYNPRKISEKELLQLKKSLKRFGFVEPVVINKDNTLIGGHQRVRAWQEMGNHKVPFIQVNIDKTKEKALNLALNKISGDWDTDKLFSVISELKISEELDFTGFDEKEISKILDGVLEEEEDEPLAEILEKAPAKTKRGDKFQLGDHILKCGDSLNLDDIQDLTGGAQMDMAWTDPPYNVNYESSQEELGSIKNDHMSAEDFKGFVTSAFASLWTTLKAGAPIYICSGWQSFTPFKESLEENNFHVSEVIIWVKNQAGIATLDYPHIHEEIIKAKKITVAKKKKAKAIFYGWKKGKHKYYGEHDEYDVWEADRLHSGKYVHPTEKPDWLVMKALKNSTKYKDKIIDIFAGGGSALMAAEKMGRKAYCMEMDERFCDAIIYKWEKLTKKHAKKL